MIENWNIEFYTDMDGNSPIEAFLDNLNAKDRVKVVHVIDLLESEGISLREPHTKKIKNTDLFELRSQFSNNIQRIFYFHFTGKTFVLLHAFTKKTERTPQKEIKIAISRKEDYLRRYN